MNKNPTLYLIDPHPAEYDRVAALFTFWNTEVRAFDSVECFTATLPAVRPGCILWDPADQSKYRAIGQERLLLQADAMPVIIVSADLDMDTAVHFMERGAVTALRKPLSEDRLVQLVNSAIDSDRSKLALVRRYEELRALDSLLTERERVITSLVLGGTPNKSIARKLEVSRRTVELVRARVLRKFGTRSAPELATKVTELWVLSETVFKSNPPIPFRFPREITAKAPFSIDEWGGNDIQSGSEIGARESRK